VLAGTSSQKLKLAVKVGQIIPFFKICRKPLPTYQKKKHTDSHFLKCTDFRYNLDHGTIKKTTTNKSLQKTRCFLVLVANVLSIFLFKVQHDFSIFYLDLLESAVLKEQEIHIQL